MSVKLVDAREGFLSDCLLVISKEKASELFPLEEVLAVVLWLGHGEDVLVGIRLILLVLVELESQTGRHRLQQCSRLMFLRLANGHARVNRLVMQASTEVAHLFDSRLLVDLL